MLGWQIDPHKLRALREEARLTRPALAAAIGMHPNSYSRLERDHQPSARTTFAILGVASAALGRTVTVADIGTSTQSQTDIAA